MVENEFEFACMLQVFVRARQQLGEILSAFEFLDQQKFSGVVGGQPAEVVADSGSTNTFMNSRYVGLGGFTVKPYSGTATAANGSDVTCPLHQI